jgi:hypothetical protein
MMLIIIKNEGKKRFNELVINLIKKEVKKKETRTKNKNERKIYILKEQKIINKM